MNKVNYKNIDSLQQTTTYIINYYYKRRHVQSTVLSDVYVILLVSFMYTVPCICKNSQICDNYKYYYSYYIGL